MSHFTVLVQIPKEVIAENLVESYVRNVLEPYSENLEVEPYVVMPAKKVLEEWEYMKKKYPESGYDKMTLEEFVSEWYGGEIDDEGNLLSTYNPNSKWDWWVVGGRWSNMIRLKDGTRSDFAQIKDIDFNGILADNRQRRAEAWDEANSKEDMNDGMKNLLYGIKPNTTREEHINGATGLTTFAVITKDGEWCEKGEMGWFGVHSATEEEENQWYDSYYKNFIEPLDEEDGVIIVDCHI